jgi:DNA-binding MarR family transcriptional regulator
MTATPPTTRAHRDATAQQILEVLPALRHRLERELPGELRDELAGATVHQVEALCKLVSSGGITMNELAAAQSIGLSSATALADRLLRQGLAQRTSDPADRRVVRLLPTDAAVELVGRFTAAKRRAAMQLLESLDDDEIASLLHLLTKMNGQHHDAAGNGRG